MVAAFSFLSLPGNGVSWCGLYIKDTIKNRFVYLRKAIIHLVVVACAAALLIPSTAAVEQNRRATMRLTDWKVFRRIGKSTFASAR